MIDPTYLTCMAMRIYSRPSPSSCFMLPSAAEILADIEAIMDEIGMSEEEKDALKLWAELESYPPEGQR